jgi:hypothetical protein
MVEMVNDARTQTKTYLDTYLTAANLTEDDDSTLVSYIVAFGRPNYPLTHIFNDKKIDLIFSIGEAVTTALTGFDHYIYGYSEEVPIYIYCVDKLYVITATKLKWKAEAELRRIVETYPLGSIRSLVRKRSIDEKLGSYIMYGTEFLLQYTRDVT